MSIPVMSLSLFLFSLLSSTNRSQSHSAVIKPGFNGTLSLPESLIQRLGWRWIGYESYEIATGDVVREKVYVGRIRWLGRIKEVDVVASHAKDILIGTRLLEGRRLSIDFFAGAMSGYPDSTERSHVRIAISVKLPRTGQVMAVLWPTLTGCILDGARCVF